MLDGYSHTSWRLEEGEGRARAAARQTEVRCEAVVRFTVREQWRFMVCSRDGSLLGRSTISPLPSSPYLVPCPCPLPD